VSQVPELGLSSVTVRQHPAPCVPVVTQLDTHTGLASGTRSRIFLGGPVSDFTCRPDVAPSRGRSREPRPCGGCDGDRLDPAGLSPGPVARSGVARHGHASYGDLINGCVGVIGSVAEPYGRVRLSWLSKACGSGQFNRFAGTCGMGEAGK
jgi:hypothetical protein